MEYLNANTRHELTSILCGRLVSDNFVHMERLIGIPVLIIVEDGVLNIEIGGVKYSVGRGESLILPPNVMHRGFSDGGGGCAVKYFWAHFDGDFSISSEKGGAFSIPMYSALADYARTRILYNQLLDIHKLNGLRQKYCDFLFTALCCEIAAQSELESLSINPAVNRAASWIEMNIDSPISLSDTAAALGYNKRYLARIFKESTKMTVNEFIMEKKLTLAKQLLTGSDESVSSIAEALGFSDAGYFMRVFKKHEGITCLSYRRAYSKMLMNKK